MADSSCQENLVVGSSSQSRLCVDTKRNLIRCSGCVRKAVWFLKHSPLSIETPFDGDKNAVRQEVRTQTWAKAYFSNLNVFRQHQVPPQG